MRLSGVPRTMSMPMTDTTAQPTKIQRHPTLSATSPPNSAANPAPPHEPIDHRLTARWRPAPSQYAFTSARLAGMMQAADRPWQMRPAVSSTAASGPEGASPTRSAPMMPSTKPAWTTRTRPTQSARPPMTTMKMPEKRAVIETAMFMTLVSRSRSAAMIGAMLSVVWANSQKARTPKIMPNRSRSLPILAPSARAVVAACVASTSLRIRMACGAR